MRKLLSLIFACCLSITSFAQEVTWNQRYKAIRCIDSIMKIYSENLSFTEANSDSISAKSMKRFKSIFASDADIFDDINPSFFDTIPEYFDEAGTNGKRFHSKTLDEFLNKTKKVYPAGLLEVDIVNLKPSYIDLEEQRIAYVAIEKEVRAYAVNGWYIKLKDSLLITIKLSSDFSSGQIIRIAFDGINPNNVNYVVNNDRDDDYVINEKDRCPDIFGYIRHSGCQPPNGPLAILTLGGSLGGTKTTFNTDGFGGTNYVVDPIEYNSKFRIPGGSGFVQVEFFLGRNRHIGFAGGIMGNYMTSKLATSSPYHAEFASDSFDIFNEEGRNFKQIVNSIGNVEENVQFTYFTPYALGEFKTPIKKNKLELKIAAGFGFPIQVNILGIMGSDGSSNNHFSYESRIALIKDEATGTYTSGYSATNSNSDIVFIINDINYTSQNFEGNADDLFGKLPEEYNLSTKSNVSKKNGLDFTNQISFIFTPTVSIVRRNSFINFGALVICDLGNRLNIWTNDNKYILSDEVGSYYSLTNGATSIRQLYVGISVSCSFGIAKGYKETKLR
jgi:hypothetical protein